MILSIVGMMADADVEVTISAARKWEYKPYTTSMYSLIDIHSKKSQQLHTIKTN